MSWETRPQLLNWQCSFKAERTRKDEECSEELLANTSATGCGRGHQGAYKQDVVQQPSRPDRLIPFPGGREGRPTTNGRPPGRRISLHGHVDTMGRPRADSPGLTAGPQGDRDSQALGRQVQPPGAPHWWCKCSPSPSVIYRLAVCQDPYSCLTKN